MGQVQTIATNYWDKMKIKSGFALVDKSDDIVNSFGTTNIVGACSWRFGEGMGLLCYGKQPYKCMAAPHSSAIAANVTTKIKHVIKNSRLALILG